MCVRPHPAFGHLVCSAFLVLWELIYLGRIEWMSELVPTFGIVFCLVFSTKMIEESKKPQPVPKWESNGYDERLNEGMIFVGDGDD